MPLSRLPRRRTAPRPHPARARAGGKTGSPNVLTTAQVAAFKQLISAAKSVDPTYLQAQAAELQKRAELSPLAAVSVSAVKPA